MKYIQMWCARVAVACTFNDEMANICTKMCVHWCTFLAVILCLLQHTYLYLHVLLNGTGDGSFISSNSISIIAPLRHSMCFVAASFGFGCVWPFTFPKIVSCVRRHNAMTAWNMNYAKIRSTLLLRYLDVSISIDEKEKYEIKLG